MNIEDLDLNLLRVLQVVARERSVSLASKKLGLSQPAVSNALRRLRVATGDPLVVRAKGGIQLTRGAEVLASAIDDAFSLISARLPSEQTFDPAISNHHFTILMSDIGETIAVPKFIESAQNLAPNATFRIKQSTGRSYATELVDRRAELLFGHVNSPQSSLKSRQLYSAPLVCLYRDDHVFAGKRMSVHDYFSAKHVVSDKETNTNSSIRLLEDKGLLRQVSLTVAHYSVVPEVLSRTTMVATLSEGLAEIFAKRYPVAYQPVPFPADPLRVSIFWHESSHQDSANQWLRQLFFKMFRDHKPRRR